MHWATGTARLLPRLLKGHGCPLRAHCTTSTTGRVLILAEHDALLRAARAG